MVSERRGSITQNRRDVNLVTRNYVFVCLGHGIIHREPIEFRRSQFSGEVWSSLSEEPQKY